MNIIDKHGYSRLQKGRQSSRGWVIVCPPARCCFSCQTKVAVLGAVNELLSNETLTIGTAATSLAKRGNSYDLNNPGSQSHCIHHSNQLERSRNRRHLLPNAVDLTARIKVQPRSTCATSGSCSLKMQPDAIVKCIKSRLQEHRAGGVRFYSAAPVPRNGLDVLVCPTHAPSPFRLQVTRPALRLDPPHLDFTGGHSLGLNTDRQVPACFRLTAGRYADNLRGDDELANDCQSST